jgi:DNA-binding IclR family transcriptional regulator
VGKSGDKQSLSCQERILVEVEKLVEFSVDGLNNKQLAFEMGISEVVVCRDLGILEKRGWIERSKSTSRWRLTPQFGNLAGTIMKCFQTAKLKLTEEEARYASAMQ